MRKMPVPPRLAFLRQDAAAFAPLSICMIRVRPEGKLYSPVWPSFR